MPLPDFYDARPYAHSDHVGTWRISTIGSSVVVMREVDGDERVREPITDWPGGWRPVDDAAQKED